MVGLRSDRELLNVEEESHPNIISHVDFFGKEVISAYWFDGLQSSLIYRFSPSRVIADLEWDGQGLLQSIGYYWAWAHIIAPALETMLER